MRQSKLDSLEVSKTLGQWSAILCSIVASYIGVAAVVLRLGLADPWILCALLAVGISWLILNGPVLLQRLKLQDKPSLHWGACFLTFVILLGVIFACRYGGMVAGVSCAILGLICFAINLSREIRQNATRTMQALVICGILSGIACAGLSWGRGFLSPVFDQGLARGIAYKDTLFHMSISNMIRTHDTSSTGLDGVPQLPYHWGSHLALGALADGISATALQAYNLIFPVVFVPLFLHSLLLAGIACGGRRCKISHEQLSGRIIGLWALVMVATIGFLPSPIGNEVGLRPSFMISESMAVAIILSALGIGVIFPRFSKRSLFASESKGNTPDEIWLAAICFPVFAGALGAAKISLLIICGALVFFVILRTPSIWKRPLAIVSLVVTFLTALVILRYCYGSADGAMQIDPFHYLKEWVSGIHRPFFFPVTLAWLALAFYLRLREMQVNSWRRFLVCLRSRRMIDLELLAVAAGVGYAVSMTIPIAGGSGVYFHNAQQWIAVVIVLGVVMRRRSLLQTRQSTAGDSWLRLLTRPFGDSTVVARIATALAIVFVVNVSIDNFRIAKKLSQARFVPASPSSPRPGSSSGEPGTDSEKQALVEAFAHILTMTTREQKKNTALWIPKSNRVFWDYLGESPHALATPFLAPALTGIAMVDGAPDPHPTIEWKDYGYLQYNIYGEQRPQLEARELEVHVENLARRQGFKRILKIADVQDGVLVSELQLEETTPLLATGHCLVSADRIQMIADQRSRQLEIKQR
ncbi:MAG: hypothetical protein P8L85_24180 [Rubripirellula sp.]|nr:hypothetical protein [Rubripirellula sp.]